jgi:hemerythrin
MYSMTHLSRELDDGRWVPSADTQRQAIIKLVNDIHTLKGQGCGSDALEAEHAGIELLLQGLKEAIVGGASRAEIIELLDTSIDFCAIHVANEKGFVQKSGYTGWDAHVAAHKHLLAMFVAARRRASGEGLSLATLDTIDSLHAFHQHVMTCNIGAAAPGKAAA